MRNRMKGQDSMRPLLPTSSSPVEMSPLHPVRITEMNEPQGTEFKRAVRSVIKEFKEFKDDTNTSVNLKIIGINSQEMPRRKNTQTHD